MEMRRLGIQQLAWTDGGTRRQEWNAPGGGRYRGNTRSSDVRRSNG